MLFFLPHFTSLHPLYLHNILQINLEETGCFPRVSFCIVLHWILFVLLASILFNNFLTFLCYSWLFSIKLVFSFSTMYFFETALKSNPLGFWRIIAVRELLSFWRVTLFSCIIIRFFLVWVESWLCWTCWMPAAAASVGMKSVGASSAGFVKVQVFFFYF